MKMNDSDLELLLQIYDLSVMYITDKNKQDFADNFVYRLADYGFELRANAKEIGEHDEYLDKSIEIVLESGDDYELDDEYMEDVFEDEEW